MKMKRMLTLVLAALMLAACVPAALAADGNETYYIHTENGKALNVRSEPNGKIVGQLKSGTEVEIVSMVNASWAMISFQYDNGTSGMGSWPAYVNRRYLTREDPAAPEEAEHELTGDTLIDINAEFAGAEDVEPYRITVRPARVSSWVNMRWIPSSTGAVLARYKATEQLNVLKELPHYLQVQDPDTGDVGYIEKQFAVRQ